ncbi:glycosyltransferase family 4 protein [Paenibacillus sp. 7541]|uniref:glycosyltransferase family 4 protein n=1 Tax=Paenibacillus sp. 7541 TaxID=2026236 RepID=UPI000BA61485|nr:glycosyltransferase family 4 protein [Paenibacillus sp. 7541]PAK52024.1 hypothetical protein CHH75_13415 [Paenibacillus sp. 7541]
MSENKHIVFVSYELHPINDGGCGVFIWSAVKEILKHINNVRITLLLDITKSETDRFNKEFKQLLPNHTRINVRTLSDILAEERIDSDFSDFNNIYLWKSYQFYFALRWLYSRDPFDYLEFFDYAGAAYFSTLAHKYENQFRDCKLSIRAHCTIDLMDIEQKQVDFNYEKILMYQMEKESLKAADIILVPSEKWGGLYKERYGLNSGQFIISPPPIDAEKIPEYQIDEAKQNILYYGRLFELKGVEIFIDAAVTFLDENPTSNSCFYLVGYSGMSVTGIQMKQALKERIPARYLNRFVFTDQVDKNQLNIILKSIGYAVFPNYVESFCYSIHELYLSGVPIICGDIPAFEKFENLRNCIKFNGSSYDLAQKMKLLSNSFETRKKISKPYSILDDTIFISSYKYILDYEKKPTHKEVTGRVSLVIFDDDTASYEEIIKHNIIDSSTSYLLSKKASNKGETSIFLFGELWYVQALLHNDNNNWLHLPLNDYYWIGRSSDLVDYKFFAVAVDSLEKHLEIDFVSSFSIQRTKSNLEKNCIPLSLCIHDSSYQINDLLRIVIRNTSGKNLREINDVRLSFTGQKVGLGTGYTIPEFLINLKSTKKKELNSVNAEATLLIHQSTRHKEWNPFILYPTLVPKKQIRPYWQQTLRKFYHKTRDFANRSNFKVINKIPNKLHQLYMKYKKIWRNPQ